MASVVTFLQSIFEIDGSTNTLLWMICGAAVWIIRERIASVFLLAALFPLSLLVSMTAYRAFEDLAMFNAKNMGEWLVWVMTAGTIGTVGVIGCAALIATLADSHGNRRLHRA